MRNSQVIDYRRVDGPVELDTATIAAGPAHHAGKPFHALRPQNDPGPDTEA